MVYNFPYLLKHKTKAKTDNKYKKITWSYNFKRIIYDRKTFYFPYELLKNENPFYGISYSNHKEGIMILSPNAIFLSSVHQ